MRVAASSEKALQLVAKRALLVSDCCWGEGVY